MQEEKPNFWQRANELHQFIFKVPLTKAVVWFYIMMFFIMLFVNWLTGEFN